MPRTMRFVLASLALCLALPAMAQEPPAEEKPAEEKPAEEKPAEELPAAAPDEDAEAAPEGMEEIIVTATRDRENLQKVPVSVATLHDETLDNLTAAGADLRFIAARVPSVNAESSFGRVFPRFYIRGLGNTDFDLNASQPVSLVYDGVVMENPMLKGFPVFDLDRVEVLRGPQGTLFGRNTPAGTIKLESRRPTDEFDAYGRIAYGQFNMVDAEGAVGGPIIDDILSGRLSVFFQRRDDYVDNTRTDAEPDLEGFQDVAARGQLKFESGEFTALLNVHGRMLDGTARVFRANAIAPGGGEAEGFDRNEVSHDGQNAQTLDSYGLVLELTQAIDDRMTLTSITGYEHTSSFSRGDIDGGFGAAFLGDAPMGPGTIPFPAETADEVPGLDQITQEFRLSGKDFGPLRWQVGGFYFHEDLTIETINFDTLAPEQPENGRASQAQTTTAWAGFGSVTWDLVDSLQLRAGLRYSDDSKDFSAERTQSPVGAPALAKQEVSVGDSNLSWDASLAWAATADINLYTRVASGFRAPSIQGRVLFGDVISTADSETIMSYEAGVKSQFMNGALRANLAGFFYTLTDQQLTAVGGAGNFNTLINAEASTGYGFELDVMASPLSGLFLTAGVSMNHTEIDDPDLTIVGGGAAGLTFLDPVVDADANLLNIDGNALPHAPEWIANFTVRYGIPVGDSGEVFAFFDGAYRSGVQFFLYESEEFQNDGIFELGARSGYIHRMDDMEFEFAGFGRNILGETAFTGGIDFNNLTGFVNEPQFFGAEAIARF